MPVREVARPGRTLRGDQEAEQLLRQVLGSQDPLREGDPASTRIHDSISLHPSELVNEPNNLPSRRTKVGKRSISREGGDLGLKFRR